MYICVCKAVSESRIAEAVAGGARNMRDLVRDTGCSSQCGKCAPAARQTLSLALDQVRATLTLVTTSQAA